MATASSPLGALMASQLTQRLAQGRPGQGGEGAGSPDAAGAQMSKQFSALAGADPMMTMKTVQQMIQMLAAMYTRTIMQVPEAANEISNMVKAGHKVVEKLQKAAATLNAVRPQIANSANLPPGFAGSMPPDNQLSPGGQEF